MNRFEPRKWQEGAAEQCVGLAHGHADRALIYACPGSGKTLGGLYIASQLKKLVGLGPKVVVLTPNLAIKSQWIERASLVGLELRPLTDAKRQLIHDELDLVDDGFVLNYQQAINCRTALQNFCDRHKPIVILDEVHHTEGPRADHDGNRWGAAVEVACRNASFKICTTGTPFRRGNQPIAFVCYNEKGGAIANHLYTYEQAIRDGICRPIEFEAFDGVIEWIDRGQVVTADFTKSLKKTHAKQRLRAAVSPDGDFPVRMLEAANAKLSQIRENGGYVDGSAAGFVVAENTSSADQIGSILSRISGHKVPVVHNKIDDSLDVIQGFRESAQPWIVGVNMLSEGIDIPRLRVGVYATNITASLYFHQFCGRLSRVIASKNERSFVFMPDDPELRATAVEIEKEKYHALGEEPKLQKLSAGNRGGKRRDIDVENSDGSVVAKMFAGHRIDADMIHQHRQRINDFRRLDVRYHHMTDAEVVKLMLDLGVVKPRDAA